MLPVTLRIADASDSDELRRLAERDSVSLPPGPHLIAIRDGGVEAAISLSSGEIVADPFRYTADSVQLLRCAAHRRRITGPRLRTRPVLRERLA